MKTTTVPVSAPAWFIVDAAGQVPGRIAAKVAHILRGKHKPTFSPHQICGDQVIILNAEKIEAHPKKLLNKMYYKHSGYIGHLHAKTMKTMLDEKPEEILRQAVYGMLPRNRQRLQLIKRVHIFKGEEHPYAPQKPVSLKLDL
ncbi:MAG: 50S ribosomal protein L13 [Candidatus Peribacteraceae bacterium]|nr:50S ribosomal protein L13 [Candidatus Peribacteraceae bacterium]